MRVLVINPVGGGPHALEFLYTDVALRSVQFYRRKTSTYAEQWRCIDASINAYQTELELVLVKSTPQLDGGNICAAVRDAFPAIPCVSVNPTQWDDAKSNIERLFNFAKHVAEMVRS